MHLTILYSAQWAFLEQELSAANTPFWVPLTILILMILLFVWGLTRGNVLDENLPNMEGSAAEKQHQGDVETYWLSRFGCLPENWPSDS